MKVNLINNTPEPPKPQDHRTDPKWVRKNSRKAARLIESLLAEVKHLSEAARGYQQ